MNTASYAAMALAAEAYRRADEAKRRANEAADKAMAELVALLTGTVGDGVLFVHGRAAYAVRAGLLDCYEVAAVAGAARPPDVSVGGRIRRLRQEAGIKQYALAEMAELHGTHLHQIETGKRNPTRTTLKKLAAALGVGENDLVPGGSEATG